MEFIGHGLAPLGVFLGLAKSYWFKGFIRGSTSGHIEMKGTTLIEWYYNSSPGLGKAK